MDSATRGEAMRRYARGESANAIGRSLGISPDSIMRMATSARGFPHDFRDQYLQDFSVTVERDPIDVVDSDGRTIRSIGRNAPIVKMEFRGKPVTFDEKVVGNKRIAIWMPGEAMRTTPLLEQTFTPADFYELSKQAVARAAQHSPMFAGGTLGITEAFMVEWCQENYKAILEQEDRRSRGTSFRDMGMWDPDGYPSWSTFKGEDGRSYTKLEPDPKAEERRLLSEMEELPGFGSF